MIDFDYRILRKEGHYEVYIEDEFYCSADTFMEAAKEVERAYELRMRQAEDEYPAHF